MVAVAESRKVQKLANILDTHEAWERRTLADLRVAGYKFTTIEQAHRYRKAQQTLARMDHDELVEFVAMGISTKREAN